MLKRPFLFPIITLRKTCNQNAIWYNRKDTEAKWSQPKAMASTLLLITGVALAEPHPI